MERNNPYFNQVKLLVQVLPYIKKYDCFALKGGTAINFFLRELPRLSVDIDLVYVPLDEREKALSNIDNALRNIIEDLERAISALSISKTYLHNTNKLIKFIIHLNNANVKVEVSPVLRGTVSGIIEKDVSRKVQEMFGFASANLSSFEDIYAGKICAALDRQHPRDLFDVKILLDCEGITEKLFGVFIVYLISCNRPIAELLESSTLDLADAYRLDFEGMSSLSVSLEYLLKTRERLKFEINERLNDRYKEFLMSFKYGNPKWDLLNLPNVENFPAIKWKQYNLDKMSKVKRETAIRKLEKVLG